jgi:ubiquinol-cytochrome c reductase cytochrome b subunit
MSEMWTAKLRNKWQDNLPINKLLPDDQPSYVTSWIYVFGVATIAALGVIIASGIILAIAGPMWWHSSDLGMFINSLHFWSVQLFFAFMVVHLWGKFWMAAWRGNRMRTWMTGAVAFVISIAAAFTGYLTQTNLDSQWISFEAKDGFNSMGVGAFFQVTNLGQMFTMHVAVLPLIVGLLTLAHVLLVRKHGVVPPIDALEGGD